MKPINLIATAISIGCLAATGYISFKNKKNMLDVIIEEIESMN